MKTLKYVLVFVLIIALLAPAGAAWADPDGGGKGGGGSGKGGKPGGETAGNNLSYPVIWAEGVAKTLPGTPGMTPQLGGEWWYQWGTNGVDPEVTPASCVPDPDESNTVLNPDGNPFCNDALTGSLTKPAGQPLADNPLPLVKAYIQKNPLNVWQAGSADWSDTPVNVHWIDWGDNLESVDWYTRSQVRTEVVLFQDLTEPMTEYEMRHTSGWGIDEVHGLAASVEASIPELGPGTRATVYSPCARLTIQKLQANLDDPLPSVTWKPRTFDEELNTYVGGYWDGTVPSPIFNGAVHEASDGPGYYNAEINVKGRIIFGYTWNVRKLNDMTGGTAAGLYRITFSFDETCGATTLNTFFVEATEGSPGTQIIVPIEEEVEVTSADEGGDTGGGEAVLRTDLNLTYIDVRILERGGGGGGKPRAAAASFMAELPFEPDEVISVDVKPQACPNVINIDLPGPEGNGHGPGGPGNGNGGEGGGHVRVAALGSAAFDVAEIQAGSVRLLVPAGDGFVELTPEAGHTVVEDVATVYPETFIEPLSGYECLAAGGDGYDDMNFMFEATELAEALAGMEEQTATLVYLTGMLEGGLSFAGADVILINEGGAPDDPGNTSFEQIFVPMARNFGQ